MRKFGNNGINKITIMMIIIIITITLCQYQFWWNLASDLVGT